MMESHATTQPLGEGPPESQDAPEAAALLADQADLLWEVFLAATDPPGRVSQTADLQNFFLRHALHIWGMARSAVDLMHCGQPYAVPVLARSALESAFSLVAAAKKRAFGPQRMAYELEELARKIELLIRRGGWTSGHRPTPEECRREAEKIRQEYTAPCPTTDGERHRIAKIDRIAQVAEMSDFYDNDYRWLSLTVHSNQAGILNSISGFLARKGVLALSNAAYFAAVITARAFGVQQQFDARLQDQHGRMEALMRRPDLLPRVPKGPDGPSTGAGPAPQGG